MQKPASVQIKPTYYYFRSIRTIETGKNYKKKQKRLKMYNMNNIKEFFCKHRNDETGKKRRKNKHFLPLFLKSIICSKVTSKK